MFHSSSVRILVIPSESFSGFNELPLATRPVPQSISLLYICPDVRHKRDLLISFHLSPCLFSVLLTPLVSDISFSWLHLCTLTYASNKWRIRQLTTEFLNTWSIHPRLQCDFVLRCLDSGITSPHNKRSVSVIEESGYWFRLNHQSGVSQKPITRKKLRTCPRELFWSHNPTSPIKADKYSDRST